MNKDNHNHMNLEKQIKFYEDHISSLEECKRANSGDISLICNELNNAYQQIALLKIRKMMMTA